MGGKVITDLPNGTEWIEGLILQGDKILVSGTSRVANAYVHEFTLARYTSAGVLDPSFGGVGYVTTAFSGGEGGLASDLAIQPDGKIVAIGRGHFEGTGWDFVVARYDANGSLDPAFNTTGIVNIDFTGGTNFDADYGRSVAIQTDGKIVVGGDPAPLGFGLARLNSDGTLDSSFGNGGQVVASQGGLRDAYEIAIQPWDNNIVASGGAGTGKSSFGTARFLADLPVGSSLVAASSSSISTSNALETTNLTSQPATRKSTAGDASPHRGARWQENDDLPLTDQYFEEFDPLELFLADEMFM